MSDYIDAKGPGCAQPVLLARRSVELHGETTIIADTRESPEGIRVLAMRTGSAIEIEEKSGGIYPVILRRGSGGGAWTPGSGSNGNKGSGES